APRAPRLGGRGGAREAPPQRGGRDGGGRGLRLRHREPDRSPRRGRRADLGDHPGRSQARPTAARPGLSEVAGVAAERTVRVAVEALADRPERAFSYRLPAEFGDPAPGSLLLVPYGRRLALGYLLPGASDAEPGIELRA